MQPFQVDLFLMSRPALYDPIFLDALLQYAVVQRDTEGRGLSPRNTPYYIHLPLRRLALHNELPLWASTAFFPLEPNRVDTEYWHKRVTRADFIKWIRGKPVNIRASEGQHKEQRRPMPLASCLVWRAWGIGDVVEVCELLNTVSRVGKKRGYGYGDVAEWQVSPVDDFSLTGPEGLRTPIPGVLLAQPLDLQYLSWTPPYWHSGCMAMCAPIGYNGSVNLLKDTTLDKT